MTTDESSTPKPPRKRLVDYRRRNANMQSVRNSKKKSVQEYTEKLTIMIDDSVDYTSEKKPKKAGPIEKRKSVLGERHELNSITQFANSDIPEKSAQKENVLFAGGSESTTEIFLSSVSDAPQYTQYIADILPNIASTPQSGKERSNGKIEVVENKKFIRFKCKICQEIFTNGEIFNEHLRSHRSEYQMEECSLCNRKFHRKDLLKHEFTLHKPKVPGQKKCSECDKEYKTTHSLHKHYATHHKEFGFVDRTKILICEICGRRCRGKHPFEIHYRTHTGEKPFLCSVCPKSFGFAEALKHHMRIHTGEKPLICKYCGKKYAHTHAYRYHLKTHTGNKPYSCENCGKRFISKYNMRAHFKSCSISQSK